MGVIFHVDNAISDNMFFAVKLQEDNKNAF